MEILILQHRVWLFLMGVSLTSCASTSSPVQQNAAPLSPGWSYRAAGSQVLPPSQNHLSPKVLAAFRQTNAAGIVPTAHLTRFRSYMHVHPRKGTPLLYVSDIRNSEVEVYDWKTHSLVGVAGGFDAPYGECSDRSGDVYVTDFGSNTVTEFPYGTTSPSRIIRNGLNDYPIGCSVSPKNGDLAVTQYEGGLGSGTGSVVVFPAGKNSGTPYTFFEFTWPAGYDSEGNLFAEGEGGACAGSTTVCLAELPYRGSSFSNVSFNQTINYPGAVQWDGRYLGFGDQEGGGNYVTEIYRSTCSRSVCTKVSTVTFADSCNGKNVTFVQWAEYSKKPNLQSRGLTTRVAAGNNSCYYSPGVNIWKYPAGGSPTRQLSITGEADGQTIVK